MEKNNYYILLDLSVDPPENNLKKIENAIKKKQAQWSRERNHPTKGTIAQKNIGLIPEIKKVMADKKLRFKHAKEAKQILVAQEKEKFSKAGRQIGILLSKGSISKNEIAKLSKKYSIKEEQIQNWIKKRENLFKITRQAETLVHSGKTDEKSIAKAAKSLKVDTKKFTNLVKKKEAEQYREIDNYISNCLRRGYITTKEIDQLKNLFGTNEDAILRRIKCPIKKKGDPTADKPSPIDKTLENLINSNLEIVGKKSLYDFLNLSPGSDLEILQKRSKEKEAEVRKIGQKDAVTTASGVLAGHCLTIFQKENSRKEYDITRTFSRIGELNADIEVAGIDNKISYESHRILIRFALNLGMDIGEAYEYIENYCKKKKIGIVKKPVNTGKKRIVKLIAVGLVAIAALAIFAVTSMQKIKESRLKTEYINIVAEIEAQEELEAKEVILKNYINSHEDNEYNAKAKKEIHKIRSMIIDREYNKTIENADKLSSENNLRGAIDALNRFLQEYPNTSYENKIRTKKSELSGKIETQEYNAIKTLNNADYSTRIKAYNAYIAKYPDSSHTAEVKELINRMIKKYYAVFQEQLNICENQEKWEDCIELCNEFINKFKGTDHANDAEGLKNKYQNKIQSQGDLAKMRQKAEEKGSDFEGARLIYLEYLEANPELPSYLKKMIVSEIKILDKKIEVQNQAEKEWEDILEYNNNKAASLSAKIKKIEKYLQKYPKGIHNQEAGALLTKLRKEKKIEDERLGEERQRTQWQNVVAYCQNSQNSLSSKINKIEQYIRNNPSGKYIAKAKLIRNQLKELKRAEDERLREQQAYLIRMQREKQRIIAAISRSGRFSNNGNGTVTDRQTRLTWTMLDSLTETNQCLNFQSASDYANRLNTGGQGGWRLPTVKELAGILKTQPAFPASPRSKWFWTSETYWHGWNKNIYILRTKGGGSWEKISVGVNQCGSVLAVK